MDSPRIMSFPSKIVEDEYPIDIWVNVDSYYGGSLGIFSGPPDRWEPPESAEMEFWLSWKKNGPPSPYLERYEEEEADRFLEEYEEARDRLLDDEEPYEDPEW